MHPEMIKAHLRMCSTTPAAVADELGVSRTAVANTIMGKIRSQRIRAHLAKLISKPESELWPEGDKSSPGLRRRPTPTKKMLRQMASHGDEVAQGGAA